MESTPLLNVGTEGCTFSVILPDDVVINTVLTNDAACHSRFVKRKWKETPGESRFIFRSNSKEEADAYLYAFAYMSEISRDHAHKRMYQTVNKVEESTNLDEETKLGDTGIFLSMLTDSENQCFPPCMSTDAVRRSGTLTLSLDGIFSLRNDDLKEVQKVAHLLDIISLETTCAYEIGIRELM